MAQLFFYGSLRDPDLVALVLGRRLADGALVPAQAPGYDTRRLRGEAYPLLLEEAGAVSDGVLLTDAGPEDMRRLAYFEEAEYGLAPITVLTADGPRQARYFRATDKTPPTSQPWDFEHWVRHDRTVAVEAARELMSLFGKLAVQEMDWVWPSIMSRARQRALAAQDHGAPLPALRTLFTPGDVVQDGVEAVHTGFVALEQLRYRHKRFDGDWTEPLSRTVMRSGDAVTLLPYDPAQDAVLLIEQFRPGPMARGEPVPWCIEVIAGRIDTDETPEAVARREAREEAGLELGPLETIGTFYPSPGISAEKMIGFVGACDLSGAGGLHGLAGEHEDIRSFVLPRGAVLEAVSDGAVNTGPALASLLWLEAHAPRLRAAWAS